MDLVNIETGKVINEVEFRILYKNVSFPQELLQDTVEPFGYVIAQTTEKPEQTEYTMVTPGQPELIDGVWYGTWVVKDRFDTPEKLQNYEKKKIRKRMLCADYKQFWKSLIRSNTYTTLKENAKVDLTANVLATELISLLGDAKMGEVDIEALQAGIWEVFSALPSELAEELRGIMDVNGLVDYTSTPPEEEPTETPTE